MTTPTGLGASSHAIEAHYDLGNAFFRLWLDPSMTSTCARWADLEGPEDLETAQRRKVDGLLEMAGARGAERVLDVGCGWGGLLRRALAEFGARHAVGLTLSPSQAAYIDEAADPRLAIRVESWADYEPEAPFDAIVSVEAFEAFARLGLPPEEKLKSYRDFFARCHRWLKPGGKLVLQTIAYGNSGPEDFDGFIATEVFPESDLPRLAEIATAVERRFEVVTLENHRHDYARTCRAWLKNLKRHREAAVAEAGEAVVVRFERYLRLSIHMFETGNCDLLQIQFRRIDRPREPRPVPPVQPGDTP
ncbi:MAG: class I SAM-dependent methyltransferase [Candidatus Sericytochromatia bacterium]